MSDAHAYATALGERVLSLFEVDLNCVYSNTIAKTSHNTQSELACLHDIIAAKTQRQTGPHFYIVIACHASCIALLSPRAVDTRNSSTNSSRHMILRAKLATHAASASVLNFYLPTQGHTYVTADCAH